MSDPNAPPPAPPEPDPGDCCGGGCNACVFDLHEAALERWRLQMAHWQARQAAPDPAGRD